MATYYDILGIMNNSSGPDILGAYGRKIHEWNSKTRTPQSIQEYRAIQQAYAILSRHNPRAAYDRTIRISNSANVQRVSLLVDYYVELHKLSWKCFAHYPSTIKLKKIFAELSSRLLMTCLGMAVGLVMAILSFSDIVGNNPGEYNIAKAPMLIKLGMIFFAAAFFFYKEIIGALTSLKEE